MLKIDQIGPDSREIAQIGARIAQNGPDSREIGLKMVEIGLKRLKTG